LPPAESWFDRLKESAGLWKTSFPLHSMGIIGITSAGAIPVIEKPSPTASTPTPRNLAHRSVLYPWLRAQRQRMARLVPVPINPSSAVKPGIENQFFRCEKLGRIVHPEHTVHEAYEAHAACSQADKPLMSKLARTRAAVWSTTSSSSR